VVERLDPMSARDHRPRSNQSRQETRMLKSMWNDESGFVISAELVLVLTVAVLAIIVGLSEVAVAVNTELNDLSNAFGALDQSYFVSGFTSVSGYKAKSGVGGSRYQDKTDDCDTNASCELVCGTCSIVGEQNW
jgi:Flp pilus assembly pilin Flp